MTKHKHYILNKDELFKLFIVERKSIRQIADMFKCTYLQIDYLLEKYEIRVEQRYSMIDEESLYDNYVNKGFTINQLAKHYQCSIDAIRRKLKEYGITPQMKKESINGYHKITRDGLYEDYIIKKMSWTELAKKYNCTTSRIEYWIKKYNFTYEMKLPDAGKIKKVERNELYENYVIREMKVTELARLYSCSETTINKYLKNFAIDKSDKFQKYSLDKLQYDIIIGSLLGDGSLIDGAKGCKLKIAHASNQKDYCIAKFKELKVLCKENAIKIQKHEGNRMDSYYFVTKTIPLLKQFANMSISDIIKKLNADSFVIWLMDDGTLHDRSYSLSLQRFKPEELNETIEKLKNEFNITCTIVYNNQEYKQKNKHKAIRFNVENSKKINDIILSSNLSSIVKSTMSYKLL